MTEKRNNKEIKGFTLIELLVVIAILSVLAVAVTLILNPGELIRQGRDSTRFSDLNNVEKALSLFQTDKYDDFMGTSSIVYVSLPDENSNCSSYDLPTLPSGWTYHCSPSDTLTKVDGTGWIPVDLTQSSFGATLSRYPIDPTNSFDSSLYYTYHYGDKTYELVANMESERYITKEEEDGGRLDSKYERGSNFSLAMIPLAGDWITIPGSSTYDTSDFEVMKYEVKCLSDSGEALTSPKANSSYNTYDEDYGCSNIASVANGYPMADVTHDEAKSYCEGLGAHLITNDEWMTIARNAISEDSNWTGGSVGSGCLFRGNSGDTTCGYDGANPDYGTSRNERAKFILSNGETIYDIAGNVWEHVAIDSEDTLIPQNNQPTLSTTADDGAGWGGWGEFTDISGYGMLSYDDIRPSNSSYNSDEGVGKLYTYGDDESSTTNRVFIRGANWYNGSDAGAFTLSLDWSTGYQNYTVGFRCAR
jgi:prepilin-type N-terminal cleavage/methylation domain-containing protein